MMGTPDASSNRKLEGHQYGGPLLPIFFSNFYQRLSKFFRVNVEVNIFQVKKFVEKGLIERGTEKGIYGSTLWAKFCGQNFCRARSFVGRNVRHLDKNSPDNV